MKPKKEYVKPTMEVIEMGSNTSLLAGSGEDNGHWNHGRENACAHGSHAWFCDDD